MEEIAEEVVVMELPEEPPKSEMASLESKALHATLWTVLSYGAGQGLRVVNSLVLTRLLLPAAFGELSLVTTLIVGMTLLSDLGLEPSVIQSKRGDDPRFLNTAWTIQVIRGCVLWLAAVVLAWPAAKFYHDPSFVYVLPVVALAMILNGFNSVGLFTLARHLGVRRLFAIDFSTQILSLLVTVTWAYYRPSVWALVVGNLVAQAFRLALSHNKRVLPGLRMGLMWDKQSVHEIVHFGKWIVLGTAFFFFASQADRLILGRLVTLTMLGLYQIAFQISDIPRSVINALSNQVGYPFVAKIIHLPMDEFRAQFLKYRGYALLVGAVLLSGMIVWGNLIILKLYTARYAEAAWIIPVLAAGLWHTMLYNTTRPVLFSLGKSNYNAVGNGAYCVAMLVGIPLGYHFFGLLGAVIAVAAGDLPLYVVTQFGATREGIRPLWQDLKLTAAFLVILLAGFGLRRVL
jgi:O-antigen/teichoic acid export membrane protein